MTRVAALALLLALAPAAVAALPAPTVLPAPPFPGPVASADRPTPPLLTVVNARARAPRGPQPAGEPPTWAPAAYGSERLLRAIRQPGRVFLLYGRDGSSARLLVAATPSGRVRYAFDFASFARAPGATPGAGGFPQQLLWARERDGILYAETAHSTYAAASAGRTAYLSAIDVATGRLQWRSPALVGNATTFVVAGDVLVSGYGFTAEPDYLFVLDRRTGRVLDRLRVPSAPERIALRGDRLHVGTYDHDLVVSLRRP